MPVDLPSGLLSEKNQVYTTTAWVFLFELYYDRGQRVVKLTNNDAPILFDGITWDPYPIQWKEVEEGSQGDLPQVVLSAGNAFREIQALLEHHNGLRNERVVIHLVHTAHLSDAANRVTRKFRIRQVAASDASATFTLSSHPFFNVEFPFNRYHRQQCPFLFRGKFCGWGFPALPVGVQDSVSCDLSKDGPNGCAVHGLLYANAGQVSLWPQRFGAFIGAPKRRGP